MNAVGTCRLRKVVDATTATVTVVSRLKTLRMLSYLLSSLRHMSS